MSAFLAIESVRRSPNHFLPSGDDYLSVFERVEREAHTEAHARAHQLAASQGIRPFQTDECNAGFWPDDEPTDDFLSWLESIRKEDGHRNIPE